MVAIGSVVRRAVKELRDAIELRRSLQIYKRYREFTMIHEAIFAHNLVLCAKRAPINGCIIECGVWRGGMSAGMADILPGRTHYLFDSFEALPPAKEIDGKAALAWQKDANAPNYYDNCRAERSFAEDAMKMSAAKQFHLIQGWFSDTVLSFVPPEPIAVLRLDGDWYDSTMECLTGLFPHVMPGGLIILDDYYTWDGCSRAVHDYLSMRNLSDRIFQDRNLCYLIKRPTASTADAGH